MFENNGLIYFDHQATTPVAPNVIEAMRPYLGENFGNPHSSQHALGWAANNAVERAANSIAEAFGADGNEVIFTSGATEANNLAIQGIAKGSKGSARNRILLGCAEHKSVLAQRPFLEEALGFEVIAIPVDNFGHLDLSELTPLLDERVLCLSVSFANSEIGTLTDPHPLASALDDIGAILHVDASQALMSGQPTPSIRDNMLISISGHKIYGPKGVGALIVPASLRRQLEPIVFGGGQQEGLRSGTLAPFLAVGFAEAVRCITSQESQKKLQEVRLLRDQLVHRLLELDESFKLNGPPLTNRHVANANICFTNRNADDILLRVHKNIAASTGSACAAGVEQISHVLNAIGLSKKDASASIRFSLGLGNTRDQIEACIPILTSALF